MAKKARTYKLYKIDWTDASSYSAGWKDIDECKIRPYKVSSTGWLVKEDKDFYVLAQNMASHHHAAELMQIPKKWITKKHEFPYKYAIQYEFD